MKKMQLCILDFDKYDDKYDDIFSLWSIIHIKIDSLFFPCDQWWDCTSTMLDMWIDSLNSFICGSVSHCTLFFMDGDYCIELTSKNQKAAVATLTGPRMEIVFSDSIDLLYFARQVLSAVGKMSRFYSDHTESKVIQTLSQKSDKLRTLMRMYL